MSSAEAVLEAIKQKRDVRDRLMLQNAIPVLNQLSSMVNTWIDEEFKDFEDEIEQVDCAAPTESASQRINQFRNEITKIRNEELPNALKELNSLIEYIKEQKFESSEQAIEMLRNKIPPTLIVIYHLTKARERLDGMADMIPIPQVTELEPANEE